MYPFLLRLCVSKEESKVVPVHAMKAYGWRRCMAPRIFNLCTRWRRMVSSTHRPLYSLVRALANHGRGRWMGPRTDVEFRRREKSLTVDRIGSTICRKLSEMQPAAVWLDRQRYHGFTLQLTVLYTAVCIVCRWTRII